jgi:hypothetical protein
MLINKGILACVNWKCFHLEFYNRVGLERWKHSNYARQIPHTRYSFKLITILEISDHQSK